MLPREASVHHSCQQVKTGEYEAALTADQYVWMLHLSEPDSTVYAENDFDLWPGETGTVRIKTEQIDFQPGICWMKEE